MTSLIRPWHRVESGAALITGLSFLVAVRCFCYTFLPTNIRAYIRSSGDTVNLAKVIKLLSCVVQSRHAPLNRQIDAPPVGVADKPGHHSDPISYRYVQSVAAISICTLQLKKWNKREKERKNKQIKRIRQIKKDWFRKRNSRRTDKKIGYHNEGLREDVVTNCQRPIFSFRRMGKCCIVRGLLRLLVGSEGWRLA